MLKDLVPQVVAQIPEIKDLFNAEQPELDRLDSEVENTVLEFYVGSFTERTAALWEQLAGLVPAPDWEIERRRERVRARLLMHDTLTAERLKEIVEDITGSEVEITEDANGYFVNIKFVGTQGVTPYLEDVAEEIAKVLPYHLRVGYEFMFTQNGALRAKTHAQLQAYTHAQIRNEVIT